MPSRSRLSLSTIVLISAFILAGGGCQRGQVNTESGPTTEELVGYYSPTSIKILPFTKPKSFDDDIIPDGIGVSLRPLDAAGDPVKAYGTFLFDLYAYRPAIGSHKGDLLQSWTQVIVNPKDQKQFWERVTSTYEFQLSWEGRPIPPQQKYILVASFQAGGSERLFDEYEFEFRVDREEIISALKGS